MDHGVVLTVSKMLFCICLARQETVTAYTMHVLLPCVVEKPWQNIFGVSQVLSCLSMLNIIQPTL